MNWFMYNGIGSTAMGIRIESKNVYSAPEREMTFRSIPGRDGDLLLPGGRYPNARVSYTVFVPAKTQAELQQKLTAIKGWLYAGQDSYHDLHDSYDPTHFRQAVYAAALDIEDQLLRIGICTITFSCLPYRYLNSGQTLIGYTGTTVTITNPTAFIAKPYMKITAGSTANGTLTQTAEGVSKAWTVKSPSSYVEVDSEMMNFYKGTASMNANVTGSGYPLLYPGDNVFKLSGSFTKLSVKPRWCEL